MSIDYGMGQTNIETAQGIRYGVISMHKVAYWSDSSEPVYPVKLECECGNMVSLQDDTCDNCGISLDFDEVEPIGYKLQDKDYTAIQSQDDTDIFITKSKYYTLCDFCSPCAPGAGYLTSKGNVKAYCFGPDMFDEYNPLPYNVYEVATDKLIKENKNA